MQVGFTLAVARCSLSVSGPCRGRSRSVLYTVEILPRAWTRLGSVPADVFRAIWDQLEALTQNPSAGGQLEVTISGYVAVITLDIEAKKVSSPRSGTRRSCQGFPGPPCPDVTQETASRRGDIPGHGGQRGLAASPLGNLHRRFRGSLYATTGSRSKSNLASTSRRRLLRALIFSASALHFSRWSNSRFNNAAHRF